MSRDNLHELLPLYADGELDAARSASVEAELERSPELRAELERWKRLRACCHRVVCCGGAPAGMEQRIRGELAGRTRTIRIARYLFATACAAAVLIAAMLWNRTPDASPLPRVEASLVSADVLASIHDRCARQRPHRELPLASRCPIAATELCKTKLLADCKTACRLSLPVLRDAGYELDGICTCPHRKDLNVVHAFYRSGESGRVVSVFWIDRPIDVKDCCPGSGACDTGRSYGFARIRDINVLKWDEPEVCFAVASDLDNLALQDLADKVQVALGRVVSPPIASSGR